MTSSDEGRDPETTQAARLAQEFSPEAHREMEKGGQTLTYIPVSEVVTRMNNVLGVNGWNIVQSDVSRDEVEEDWVIASCTIEAEIDGVVARRTGWGGQKIKQLRSGGPVDLGDEFKGAASDAFKKAASLLGVALYLSRDEEAIAAEEQARYRLLSSEELAELAAAIAKLPESERTLLSGWWKEERLPRRDSGHLNENHLRQIHAFVEAL